MFAIGWQAQFASRCPPQPSPIRRNAVAHIRAPVSGIDHHIAGCSFSEGLQPAQTRRCSELGCNRSIQCKAVAAPEAPVEAVRTVGRTAREEVRSIAIIAHVDHGKTTLVDAMLRQSKVFRENQAVAERVMDSNDIERERGITILSKNTAVTYKGIKINIIDTPGHADFGGEVERVLNMCDGVLLLVDSVEGPMPQTRFVLRKALELEKKVIVVINKIDRPAARPDYVIDATFDLFVELGASDEQCDFPVVYASGVNGVAGTSPQELAADLQPLFDAIVREIEPPMAKPLHVKETLRAGAYETKVQFNVVRHKVTEALLPICGSTHKAGVHSVNLKAPLQMLVTNLDYDEHKGRIAIGRITSGKVGRAEGVVLAKPGEKPRPGKINEVFVFENFARVAAEEAEAGDICAVTGLPDCAIGDTICCSRSPTPLPTIKVEEPTVRMTFLVNTSAFAGREGKYVTSRNLKERLERELERNLALKVEPGETADQFVVSGRGALHICILMENMRREGYEFAVGPPKVITKDGPSGKLEPYEEAIIEVPEEHVGQVVDLMGSRKGNMLDMSANAEGGSRITYRIPTRGLLGLRNAILTATKGTAVLNTIFKEYGPWCGEINTRENGSLVAHETGQVTGYALESVQQRGRLFVQPGEEIYENQVIGIHQRGGDLKVNACKKKAATNIRSAGAEKTVPLSPPIILGLDDALEYIEEDELVEVTPLSVRVRKAPSSKRIPGGAKK